MTNPSGFRATGSPAEAQYGRSPEFPSPSPGQPNVPPVATGGTQIPQLAQDLARIPLSLMDLMSRVMSQAFSTGDVLQREMVRIMSGALQVRSVSQTEASQPKPIFGGLGGIQKAEEYVTIGMTRGKGTLSEDKKFITLNNAIITIDGREVGVHQGVWERRFDSPEQLLAKPPDPTPPLDRPVGPVPPWPVAANTKAVWNYAEGALYSVGPAASHLIPLSDSSFLFLVSTAQVITSGTGAFEGIYGLTQSLGATCIPADVNLFAPNGPPSFPAVTIDTFRYVIPRVNSQASSGVWARSAPTLQSTPPRQQVSPQAPTASPNSTLAAAPAGLDQPVRWPAGIESKFIQVCGSGMHYLECGSGNPIVLVHGNPTWSYLWRNVIPHLLGYGRCIVPDLIGMGMSDKPAIGYSFFDQVRYFENFLAQLALRDITLVLHDWGSAIGFYYAMRHQRNVSGIVFFEALLKPYDHWEDFPPSLRETFYRFRTPNEGYQEIVVQNQFIEQLLPHSMFHQLTPQEFENYRRPFVNPNDRKVILRFVDSLPIEDVPADVTRATLDYSRWLRNVTVPKLLLTATPGAITTESDVEWCKLHLSRLTVESIGRSIHFYQEDNPEGVGKAIAKWMAQRRE
jgi:haloalkane dehalogenase